MEAKALIGVVLATLIAFLVLYSVGLITLFENILHTLRTVSS